jgi:hypothetical protein
VLRALSLCTCCRHYPGAADGRTLRSYSPVRISLPRKGCRVGLHIVLFEVCSAFTHVAARTLARSPNRDPLPEGFRHFVSSMPAPVASGGSDFAGWALHPLENAAFSRRAPIADRQHRHATRDETPWRIPETAELSLIARLRAPPAPDDRETVTHCDRRRQQRCALINGRAVGFSAARGQSGDLDVSGSAAIEFL